MSRWLTCLGGAALSGALFALSLPPASWQAVGWVCLAPMLASVRGRGFLVGFVGGLLTSIVAACVSLTPLVGPSVLADASPEWNFVGFGLYGIVTGFAGAAVGECRHFGTAHVPVLASLGVLLELATFVKMPAHLALSQYASHPMLAVASVTGIWGVSWLVWASNLTVVAVLTSSAPRQWLMAPAIGALASMVQVPSIGADSPYGLVQTGKFGADELLKLQAPLRGHRPQLVVWPELSVSSTDTEALDAFSQSPEGWPVVASYHDGAQPKTHNAARVFGRAKSVYFKRQPFGAEAAEIQRGSQPVVVATRAENVGLNICFDSCFPWVMRETVLNGAELIALPTLDPKSPNGFVQAAHAAFTPFRAAELGVPILRSEATAWSMAVDGRGRITGWLPTGYEGPLAVELVSSNRPTVYRMWGDWFLVACVLTVAVPMCRSVLTKWNRTAQ